MNLKNGYILIVALAGILLTACGNSVNTTETSNDTIEVNPMYMTESEPVVVRTEQSDDTITENDTFQTINNDSIENIDRQGLNKIFN